MTRMRRRAVAAAAALGTTIAIALSTSAASASATVTPQDSIGGNGDASMYLGNPTNGSVLIIAYTGNTSFYGHFQLLAPTGSENSPDIEWHPGYSFGFNWPAIVGMYCVIAWQKDQSTGIYYNIGEPCLNIE